MKQTIKIGYIGRYAGRDAGPDFRTFALDNLTFSDNIAFDQLLLAMERNLLIHITASINMVVVGLAMLRFFSRERSDFYVFFGFLAFSIGAGIFLRGIIENARLRRAIDQAIFRMSSPENNTQNPEGSDD